MNSLLISPKEEVEEIWRSNFSIGEERMSFIENVNPGLCAELFAKNINVFMELIQDADEQQYPDEVDPLLEFIITSTDITHTGAEATLIVFTNDTGLSREKIESVCGCEKLTKTRLGNTGVGLQSVLVIAAEAYLFSKGFAIKISEKFCNESQSSHVIPEWVENTSALSEIEKIYGSTLPTTTLVLPLKPDNVKSVKLQLSNLHHEVIVFLQKIKRINVREDKGDGTLAPKSISIEKSLFSEKTMGGSYTVHINVTDADNVWGQEWVFYMWHQQIQINNGEPKAKKVSITLAFPHGKLDVPGIYSVLPTETVTNFPFIIQADFQLEPSRKSILWNSNWNDNILQCVPNVFINAFGALVKSVQNAPDKSIATLFFFLPLEEPSHLKLKTVQETIRLRLLDEAIIPCDECDGTKKYYKSSDQVGTVATSFVNIMHKAKMEGWEFDGYPLPYVLSSFNKEEFKSILNFLEIKPIDGRWYIRYLYDIHLLDTASEDLYAEMLSFIAEEWESWSKKAHDLFFQSLILKGEIGGQVSYYWWEKLLIAKCDSDAASWIMNWNRQFQYHTRKGLAFMPAGTQEAIRRLRLTHPRLEIWLKDVGVEYVDVYGYADLVRKTVDTKETSILYACFLYTTLQNEYLMQFPTENLCGKMPIFDRYGKIIQREENSSIVVPIDGSTWHEVLGGDFWLNLKGYVEMNNCYKNNVTYFGGVVNGNDLISFLKNTAGAADLPNIALPDKKILKPRTNKTAMLLLDWIYEFITTSSDPLPYSFLTSIRDEKWLQVLVRGNPSYAKPTDCFLLNTEFGQFLRNGSLIFDVPFIDENIYAVKYKQCLETIGVMTLDSQASEFVDNRINSLPPPSELTKQHGLSILKLMEFLQKSGMKSDRLSTTIKGVKWLKTTKGYMTPGNSILSSSLERNPTSAEAFIDRNHYGEEIFLYSKQLVSLGVKLEVSERKANAGPSNKRARPDPVKDTKTILGDEPEAKRAKHD